MAQQLRDLGYKKATSAGVWRGVTKGKKHLDLEFEGEKFEEWMRSPIAQMSLIDLIEMIRDWHASAKRTKNGDIKVSLEVNIKRFHIDEQVADILRNTLEILEEGVE